MGGSLWRDVVNLLEDDEPTPRIFLPLLEHIAEYHADAGYFLGWIPKHLTNPGERAELDADIRRGVIGFAVWQEQREALLQWVAASTRGSFTIDQMADWWFSVDRGSRLGLDDAERFEDFFVLIRFDREDPFIQEQWGDEERDRYFFIQRLRKDLVWLRELALVRTAGAQDMAGRHARARALDR